MKMIHENPASRKEEARVLDNKCYQKATKRHQHTFTLVEQDKSSPRTICYWIMENIETCPAAKLIDALQDAIAMRNFSRRKHAD